MSNTKHSPTPWRLSTQDVCVAFDSTDEIVFDTYGGEHPKEVEQANAAFIIRAVNSHDQLVAALRDMIDAARATEWVDGGVFYGTTDQAEAVLRAAEA